MEKQLLIFFEMMEIGMKSINKHQEDLICQFAKKNSAGCRMGSWDKSYLVHFWISPLNDLKQSHFEHRVVDR